jgi:hypothetical protein
MIGKVFNLFCFLLVLWSKLSICQSNYLIYHRNINHAENYLIKGEIDSALFAYQTNFEQFPFIFPRDALIAAQYAYYFQKKDKTLYFIVKSFQQGVTPYHLFQLPVLKSIFEKDLKLSNFILDTFIKTRPLYLKKINKEALKVVVNSWWKEQLHRQIFTEHSIKRNGKCVLDSVNYSVIQEIRNVQNKYGFPGQKIIGIIHDTILHEVKIDTFKSLTLRFEHLLNKEKYRFPNNETQVFNLTRKLNFVSNDILCITLYHSPCAFYFLGGTTILIEEIKKGNLHPHDFATLYDLQHHPMSSTKHIDKSQWNEICPLDSTFKYGFETFVQIKDADTNQVNKNRLAIGMASSSHLASLYNYSRKYDIIVKFGYMDWK